MMYIVLCMEMVFSPLPNLFLNNSILASLGYSPMLVVLQNHILIESPVLMLILQGACLSHAHS